MPDHEHRLQVLIANEHDERFESISAIVEELGHEIVGRGDIGDVGPLSRSTGADVALVGLGLDGEHALEQISAIVHEAACPVIALLDAQDPRYVHEQRSEASSPTSSLRDMTEASYRAPSTSRCGGLLSSKICKARSGAARSSNKPRASSWSETGSTPTPRSLS